MPNKRQYLDHLDEAIAQLRAELTATADRLDAALTIRDTVTATDLPDLNGLTWEDVIAAQPSEIDAAHLRALTARFIPEQETP